jgi:alanine racemase
VNRGPVAEVNLSAIAHNLHTIRNIVKNRPVIAVVKADAYGHGAVEVSRKLQKETGISHLAVAFAGEAKELRDAGITLPVIVLFDSGNAEEFFDQHLIPVISDREAALTLSQEAQKRAMNITVHVKVDTGMGRMGLHSNTILDDLLSLSKMPGIEIGGILSHFSEADLGDRSFADQQLTKFNALRDRFMKKMGKQIIAHIANSAAVLSLEQAHLDAVRPGIMLYGYSPMTVKSASGIPDLVPAMTVKASIISIRNVPSGTPISYGRTFVTRRPSRIGVLAIGYADGYSRNFSNNAHVLVKGMRVPVVGRVCMDLTMVDLTDVDDVNINDEAVIMGMQGSETISADELAERSHTISYEILTSLGSRSRRKYVENH